MGCGWVADGNGLERVVASVMVVAVMATSVIVSVLYICDRRYKIK